MIKQKPMAWIWEDKDGYQTLEFHDLDVEDMENVGIKSVTPLYAKPQPLTEDEIIAISADCAATHQHMDIEFARAIETALGIEQLNTEETV